MTSKIKNAIKKIIMNDNSISDEGDLSVDWTTIQFDEHNYRVGFRVFNGIDWNIKFSTIKLTRVLFCLED
jgi:hypothetical protein